MLHVLFIVYEGIGEGGADEVDESSESPMEDQIETNGLVRVQQTTREGRVIELASKCCLSPRNWW
jgi:hypothetical protein